MQHQGFIFSRNIMLKMRVLGLAAIAFFSVHLNAGELEGCEEEELEPIAASLKALREEKQKREDAWRIAEQHEKDMRSGEPMEIIKQGLDHRPQLLLPELRALVLSYCKSIWIRFKTVTILPPEDVPYFNSIQRIFFARNILGYHNNPLHMVMAPCSYESVDPSDNYRSCSTIVWDFAHGSYEIVQRRNGPVSRPVFEHEQERQRTHAPLKDHRIEKGHVVAFSFGSSIRATVQRTLIPHIQEDGTTVHYMSRDRARHITIAVDVEESQQDILNAPGVELQIKREPQATACCPTACTIL
jgi:hypothetical protein